MSSSKEKKRLSYRAYRHNLIIQLEKEYPKLKSYSNILGALFLISLFLTIGETYVYSITIIALKIPLCIWFGTGIIVTPFLKKFLDIYIINPYNPGKLPIFFHILYNVVTWGGFSLSIFMFSNYFFRDGIIRSYECGIISYGHNSSDRYGCGESWATINYKGEIKELDFACGTPVEKYKTVDLQVSQGFFGFDVIENQVLKEDQW